MPIRRAFPAQYVSLSARCKPARRRRSRRWQVAVPERHRLATIMRENNEGEYSEIGGRMFPGTDYENGVSQETVLTKHRLSTAS
jgi:tartrate dehydrogenase/decarboxylase/D-malate dehydrogenase